MKPKCIIPLLCILLAGSCKNSKRTDLSIPKEMIRVEEVPGEHNAMPGLIVEVDQKFSWPDYESKPVVYGINLIGNTGDTIYNAGTLTGTERFSTVDVLPADFSLQLLMMDDSDYDHFIKSTEQLKSEVENEDSMFTLHYELALDETLQKYGLDKTDTAKNISTYRIEIFPKVPGGDELKQELPPSDKAPSKYTWGKVIDDANDPCKGKKPEDCANEKLQKIIDRICNEKKGNTPRFPRECEALKKMQGKKPPQPLIDCMLTDALGKTNPVDSVITLNGNYFLTGSCVEATVLHELMHFEDLQDNKLTDYRAEAANLGAYMEACHNYRKALEEYKKATAKADKDKTFRDAMTESLKMHELFKDPKFAGGMAERIASECRAYSFTLDNADFFGYPGMGTAWCKQNIKAMVGEIFSIIDCFIEMYTKYEQKDIPDAIKKNLCDCFTNLQNWIQQHGDIKTNLDQDSIAMGPKKYSYNQTIGGLKNKFCK